MYNRESVYRDAWEHCDRLGMLKVSQVELADLLGIPYQQMSLLFKEFRQVGYIKKFRWRFQLKDPDSLDWSVFRVHKSKATETSP